MLCLCKMGKQEFTLDSRMRESDLKPSNSLAMSLPSPIIMLISSSLLNFAFLGVLYQFFNLMDVTRP